MRRKAICGEGKDDRWDKVWEEGERGSGKGENTKKEGLRLSRRQVGWEN